MFTKYRGAHNNSKKIIIIMIEGGIGDHFLATPLLRVSRTIFPKDTHHIIVMAMYHEVFGYKDTNFDEEDGDHIIPTNPNIDVLFSMRLKSNFYVTWAKNADKIFRCNPYILSPHRIGSKHLAQTWCDIHQLPFDELLLEYNTIEKEEIQVKQLFSTFEQPIVIVQPYGAYDTIEQLKTTDNKDWDDNKWQYIIDWLTNRSYQVIQIGKLGEHVFNNVFSLTGHATLRESIALLKYAEFFVSIDSFAQHAAKAFNKQGVVLWGRTNPFRVGYKENYNVFKLQSCPELFCGRPESILFDMDPKMPYFTPWKCPHRNCMAAISPSDVTKGIGNIERRLELDPIKYNRKNLNCL